MSVVAGVDSSTQSTTVALHDAGTGDLLGSGSAPHPATYPPVSEQSPETWWSALVTAMGAARASARVAADDVVAIAIAAQCHALVPLDEQGAVIRPAKLWNDTTAAAESLWLHQQLSPLEWARRTGSVPGPAFTASKLVWFARHEPDRYARLARIALPHDWLTLQLTGRLVSDRSDASGTGWFSAARNQYDDGILATLDPDRDWNATLPDVLGPQEQAGTILPRRADELGVSRTAVVGPGAGDQHAGAVGIGARPGDIVFVFGTSGVVYGLSDHEVHDPSGVITAVADVTGGFQPLTCAQNAAKVTDTVARLLGVDHDELTRLALAAPRRPDRPVLRAYLDGERTPDRPDARGLLARITSRTTREELALAAFEGVVLGMDFGRQVLESYGLGLTGDVIAIGGGARSQAYTRVLADTVGAPVQVVDVAQPVARGAAIQASAVLHRTTVAQVRDAWRPARRPAAEPTTPLPPEVRDTYATLVAWKELES